MTNRILSIVDMNTRRTFLDEHLRKLHDSLRMISFQAIAKNMD